MKPGRHLNVIVGPNGSGKSTIVAAIVLGLGGKPNIIGRALHVGEYVKFGCDSARIEIHLKNDIEQDSVVTRTLTKEGKSTWMINGNQANAKSVQEFTSKLNIQVYVCLKFIFFIFLFLESSRLGLSTSVCLSLFIKPLFGIRFVL